MPSLNPIALGVVLLILGSVFYLIVQALLRYAPRLKPAHLDEASPPVPPELSSHGNAVMLIQSGGRVAYLNQQAREWFNIWDEEPNLERMARRARPSDTLISLCSGEGQAQFTLNGRIVTGTSYYSPSESGRTILVSLRRPQFLAEGETTGISRDGSNLAFTILSELSQVISASLELEPTLQAILEAVERLVPSDFSEITIWEEENQNLIPYRFVGLPGVDRHLEKSADRYLPGEGYSGYIAEKRQTLLVKDVNSYREVRPILDRQRYPFQSYLGIPLLLAGELVGTLELASLTKETFTSSDVDVVNILAGQAAIALHNAILYQVEQQRTLVLTGLANLAQAAGNLRDTQDLYARLLESISPLLKVEVLGFLIYDETRHLLSAQTPFQGVPANVVEWYRTVIQPDSSAEEVWLSQEALVSANAPADERIEALGFHHLAQAAGLRTVVYVPLTSGGRSLGYLQAGNKLDGSPFDQDEVRLLEIIAGQAAMLIENAALVTESRRRAQRAETLRRIASLTSSNATVEEIVKYSLLDLVRLLQAEIAAVMLLDENRGDLRVHKSSLFGVSPELGNRLGRIPVNDPQFSQTVTGSRKQYVSGDLQNNPNIPPIYRQFLDLLQIRSVIVVPLIVRERGIGELMLGSYRVDFFTRGDVLSAATVAGQLAAAIEQSTLSSQTDQNLRQRVDRMISLTQISREINSTLDWNHLLKRVFEEAVRTTAASCGSILLFDINPSEEGNQRILLHLGCSTTSGLSPWEQLVVQSNDTLVIDDFEHPTTLPENVTLPVESLKPPHAGIHSALIVPIAYQERVAGLIHLHSKSSKHFEASAVEITEALSIQAAIALGNAYRYQEQVQRTTLLSHRIETLSKLLETSQELQAEQPLDQALEAIAFAMQETTPFEIILISVYDPISANLLRLASAGVPLVTMEELRARPQPWNNVARVLKPEFSLGRAYFIPYEQMPILPLELHAVTVLTMDNAPGLTPDNLPAELTRWHSEDMLLIPLYSATNQPLGLISVDAPRNGLRPDRATLETLEIFSSQAAVAIENYYRLDALHAQVSEIQRDLNMAQQVAIQAQEHLPTLLHKDLAQTLTIRTLSRRYSRVSASLAIAQLVNRQTTRQAVLQVLAQEMLVRMEMDVVLVVEPTSGGVRLLLQLGNIPPSLNPEALLGQRNPLRHCLQTGEVLLVANQENSEWRSAPLLAALDGRGFVSLPIIVENRPEAALMAVRFAPLEAIGPEDYQLYRLLGGQVALALQNLKLTQETDRRLREVTLLMEFSRQLGSLDPTSILQTLVDSAMRVVPAAQGVLVALWDDHRGLLWPMVSGGYPRPQSLMQVGYQSGQSLPGQAYQQARPLRVDEVAFARHYAFTPEELRYYRDGTGGKLPVSSMVIPIIGTKPLGVIVMDNFATLGAFVAGDEGLITSLAQQTALSLENARLYQASEQRFRQLQALTDVSATITSSLEPGELIATLLNQLEAILPYDTGILWLRQDEKMVVRAARGFADSEQRLGLTVDIKDSALLNEMITTGRPLYVSNLQEDARFPSLLEYEHLSWLGVPLISAGQVNGVIALEKTEAGFYRTDHLQLAVAFASQAAVALENAQLYQESLRRAAELDQRSQFLGMLNRLSYELSGSLDQEHILQIAIQELYKSIHCSSVTALLFNNDERAVVLAEIPGTGLDQPLILPDCALFERLRQTLGIFNTDDVVAENELVPLTDFLRRYRTQSLLALSLASGNQLQGMLLAHTDYPYRFDADEVELARTISNQVSIAIQNAHLFAETRSLTEDLEERVKERTVQVEKEHLRTEALLRIITELSASLDLEQVLNRTLRVLNEMVNAEQITVMIARPGERKLHRLASVGYAAPVSSGGSPSPFNIDQGLAGWVIKNRKSALVDDLSKDPRWIQRPNTPFPQHRSALVVPLMIGAEALGSLLLFHHNVGHFYQDQLTLVQAAANQIAVAVNNAELYRLIRDQAEDLGSMLRSQQIETSRTRAILEATADGILVTDARRQITLFNASAEHILGLRRTEVMGKSLEYFSGLFGRTAQLWYNTITKWSQNPNSYVEGDIYSEQISLENGRVVSVNLTPVIMRNDFLGTVSTFQDITHQVEVDRLKSEFVATVSHELRTPMTSIKGYTEILLMGAAGGLNEQQTRFLEVVKTNTERLSVLVNDLLDISRIEAGRITLSLLPLDLTELADSLLAGLESRSRQDNKPVTIVKDYKPGLPPCQGDIDRVRQVMENLLDNAYLYNTPGGKIVVRMRPVGEDIQVDVQDTGLGIPLAEQGRVFERFFRGESPLALGVGGTGLGLSIVQTLVEMHGGRIWLKSSGIPGEGATFSFTLPIYNRQDNG